MNGLFHQINQLKNSPVQKKIQQRINEFQQLRHASEQDLFRELCFCILAANFNSQRTIDIVEKLSDTLYTSSEKELSHHLRNIGYRFPNIRACYIAESQHHCTVLPTIINSLENEELRQWLVENIKGLGYKEASHFLRNIGFTNYAIIDFHIIDLLCRHQIIQKPQTLTPKKYLEIERILKYIAEKASVTLAELDLYLWYIETGKILK
jgi:N-glycosylase/DNA lyase